MSIRSSNFGQIGPPTMELSALLCLLLYIYIQLVKAYRIKFQKFAAHAHKDALINETFIPT